MEAGVPLVPAAVKGSDKLLRLAKLKVAYGEPVPYDDLSELPPRDAHQAATERLMERIYALHAAL
jgi:1-acyl-sn-glycerol-3-phosphate acyltransferase